MYFDDYSDHCKPDMNRLIEHNYVKLSTEGYIKLCDIKRIYILKDLNNNEVISYWRYSLNWQKVIDEMQECGIIKFENLLFSKPGQDYINYYLNKASFNNILGLRNMYSHGTQSSGDGNEDIHKGNYMIFLRLLILTILKINDELCIDYEHYAV